MHIKSIDDSERVAPSPIRVRGCTDAHASFCGERVRYLGLEVPLEFLFQPARDLFPDGAGASHFCRFGRFARVRGLDAPAKLEQRGAWLEGVVRGRGLT